MNPKHELPTLEDPYIQYAKAEFVLDDGTVLKATKPGRLIATTFKKEYNRRGYTVIEMNCFITALSLSCEIEGK